MLSRLPRERDRESDGGGVSSSTVTRVIAGASGAGSVAASSVALIGAGRRGAFAGAT